MSKLLQQAAQSNLMCMKVTRELYCSIPELHLKVSCIKMNTLLLCLTTNAVEMFWLKIRYSSDSSTSYKYFEAKYPVIILR